MIENAFFAINDDDETNSKIIEVIFEYSKKFVSKEIKIFQYKII